MRPPDHSYFEELAALFAGGHLSEEELRDYREHALTCPECQQSEEDFSEIVQFGLPLTQSPIREFYDKVRFRPAAGSRERFLQCARREGIRFSPEIERSSPGRGKRSGFVVAIAGAAALAAAAVTVAIYPKLSRPSPAPTRGQSQSQLQLEELRRENADLKAKMAAAQKPADSQQGDLKSLREQLRAAVAASESNAHTADQLRTQAQEQTARDAELQAKLQNNEKLLADARSELAHSVQQHNDELASTVALRTKVNDLSEQLRVANTNLELERQLLAQGKDVRDLMGARQLHVVDVRDTDSTGKPGKAFGRVFLTEGKSLIFYAFDLNEAKLADAKQTFQVWGQEQGKTASVRSLGFLFMDNKTQRRWALKVDNPKLVSEIDSVFVTVEPAGGTNKPTGQRMLYAYFGEANHP